MMSLYVYLSCFVGVLSVHCVLAYHFRGGILTWRSLEDQPGFIEVTHRTAWKKDYRERHFDVCNQTAVDNGTQLSIGKSLSCNNTVCIPDMKYVCTDYNTAGDYAAGVGTQVVPAPNGAEIFDISFGSCCWVNLVNYGSPRNYLLKATVDLSPRGDDTGGINSSPHAAIVPIQLVQQGCNHVIRIPVSDPDGDFVRCRFADPSKEECSRVCGALDNAYLRNTETECVLMYSGGQSNVGWHAVTIMIEDFPRRRSRRALSRVPLHFLINVTAADEGCHQPRFVQPTPENGDCIPAMVGELKMLRLAARSDNPLYVISGISTFGLPLHMSASPLTQDPDDPLTHFIDLIWVPQESQVGPHQICFAAFDRKDGHEFASNQVCITVYVGAIVAHPQPMESSPSDGETVPITMERWEIKFNSTISQRTTDEGAIVSFIQADTNTVVHTVNLATPDVVDNDNVQFPMNTPNTVVFATPGWIMVGETEYIIRVHEGAVVSASGCKPKSERGEWRFVTGPDYSLPATQLPPEQLRRPTAVPECFSSYMAIYVSKAWLATVSSLVDPAAMYLNDPLCVGEEFNETHFVIGTGHDMCGTEASLESNEVQIVSNTVHIPPQPAGPGSPITRDHNIEVHVICRLPGLRVTYAEFDPNVTTLVYYEVGYGTFNFQLRMFADELFRRKFRPNDYPVDVDQRQRVFFEARVISNEDMSVFIESCRATPTANPRDLVNYVFIEQGCAVDNTVELYHHPNSLRKRFSIEAFAFLGNNLHGSVFVHCDLATCHAADTESLCARGCVEPSARRRRDVNETGALSSKAYSNTDGPIKIKTSNDNRVLGPETSQQFNFALVELPMLTVTIVLLVVILIVLVRAFKVVNRSKVVGTPVEPHRVQRVMLPSIPIGSEH